MSVISLDNFGKFNNEKELKFPGIETNWKVTFDDKYRTEAAFIASKIEKMYEQQQSSDFEDKLLAMSDAKRKVALEKQLDDYKKACIEGLNTLLNDGKAGQQLYDYYGHSTEVLAQIIEAINEAADKTLTMNKEGAKLSEYDAED